MSVMKATQPNTFHVLGIPLRCQICNHAEFEKCQAQLNTAGATFLGFDWANRSADCYVCKLCGHIHWFMPK